MRTKSKIIFMIICIALMLIMVMQSASYATVITDSTKMLYIGITELRTNDTPNLGYAIGDPNNSGAKIWNLREFTGASSTASLKTNGSKDIYCLRAGLGFRNTGDRATYDVSYNMKTEKSQIAAHNDVLSGLVNGTVPYKASSTAQEVQVSKYGSILALGDMLYLINDDNNAKMEYLKKAGIRSEAYGEFLTRDEIAAVQQAALWYFTNNESQGFDKTENTGWLYYTENGTRYQTLDVVSRQRNEQAEKLYNYLIQTAKSRASQYENITSDEAPARVTTTTLNSEQAGSNYVIGPINIARNTGNPTDYEIEFLVNDKTTGYQLLNSNKQAVSAGTTVKDLVGQNFYISVPTTTTVKININIKYSNITQKLWTATEPNGSSTQPLLIPEKVDMNIPVTLSVTPTQKKFDLALRKYITKVGDRVLVRDESRQPIIDTANLEPGTGKTTANYAHKKDPVEVKTGMKVIYNIAIYNEGETVGRATKVVDQLPTGLKFDRVVDGNFEVDSYNTTTNRLNLKRKSGNNTNLDAYVGGDPSSEVIQIECTVVAKATENRQVLTNLAWISEEVNGETNETITTQVGLDRDSEPGTITILNKDELVTSDDGYTGNTSNSGKDLSSPLSYFEGQQDDDDFEKIVLLPKVPADLKLVKRIVEVNETKVPERIENVDVSKLNKVDANGKIMATTADYKLNKDPIEVRKGDIVTYIFRVYNEGMIDAYASEITEDIPEGLKYLGNPNEANLTDAEKEAAQFNKDNGWGQEKTNADGTKTVSTDFLSKDKEGTSGANLIEAFGENNGTKTDADLKYKEVSIKFKVVSDNITGTVIRNEAAITEDTDENGDEVDDRDSDTEEWKKYEDDEDYDNIILKQFDLALRKFIIAVSKDEEIEDSEYLKIQNGALYERAPVVDTSKLNTVGADGKVITTATYNHTKEPIGVRKDDIVVYMLRVYNEGDIDGYAAEIKDHLPPHLEFVDSEYNKQYGWKVSEDGRTVTTKYLSSENNLIGKAEKGADGKYVLKYKEVPIMCRVKDTAVSNQKITNIADITEYKDDKKNPVEDRDSEQNNVQLPADENLPGYKDDETGSYIPGQQDDDDFEKVVIKEFDLALRKFIVAVSKDEKIEDNEYLKNEDGSYKRAPVVDTSKLNTTGEDGKLITTATYNHTKEPLLVFKNDIVVYMLRVYNEGDIDGYAAEIKDHLPPHLEFVDSEFNKQYGWEVSEDGRTVTTEYLSSEDKLINKAEKGESGEYTLDYQEVPIMCKVKDTAPTSQKITNIADITVYEDDKKNPVDDRDSEKDNVELPTDENLPGYKDNETGEYIPGQQDDDDFEKIIIKKFDLALRKWVTQAIVTDNTGTKVTNTGHQPYDDPEGIVKVELDKKKLNQVTVKFRYSIRVINEGDIEGYAKEVTDYIPAGLKFIASDNPGWKDEGNNVISTRLLENTLLKPGEFADVEVLLTWENNQNNMGLKTNTAEISEDHNEYNVPDEDSTPDNKKPGEDDIDDAPVMLSVKTGQIRIYFTLGFIVLITIAGGIVLIKKYVL